MLKIGIIIGSTRPNRKGEAVAKWTADLASKKGGADFELIDIRDYDLPLLDEGIPASQDKYSKDHTKKWAEKIGAMDAFIFVSPEYNHSTSGALKNALDFLYKEWNNKAAGFVSYGSAGGCRAIEHLRAIMGELQIADVHAQVMFTLTEDFENYSVFKPRDKHKKDLEKLIDQVISWGEAMNSVRNKK